MCQLKSIAEFKSLVSLIREFSDDKKCVEYLKRWRWNGKPYCPHCQYDDKIYTYKDGKRYKCASCLKQFTVTVGTIFHSRKIPLLQWYIALYLNSTDKKGISSVQLATDLGISQKTAWYMLTKIRSMYKQNNDAQLEGVIMADETFVGGKNKNRHLDKKVKNGQGRTFKDKIPVLGLMQLDGQVKTFALRSTASEFIKPIIFDTVKLGSVLVSDEWWAYRGLEGPYQHEMLDHTKRQYVTDNGFTTNPMEGFWANVKRTYTGTYHKMSKKHIQRYMDEITFRYNTRHMESGERLNLIMGKVSMKLTYKMINDEKVPDHLIH
jgi:transposase-like protein